MAGKKSPKVREQELLEERAALVGDAIRNTPGLVEAVTEAHQDAQEGKGIPAREYFEQRDKSAV